MLAEQAIPRRLLSQALTKGANRIDIWVALDNLQAYSMMSRRKIKADDSHEQLYYLHPLVRSASWDGLEERKKERKKEEQSQNTHRKQPHAFVGDYQSQCSTILAIRGILVTRSKSATLGVQIWLQVTSR
jgi:hypothetical protein